jgi:putative proteasome-type protease
MTFCLGIKLSDGLVGIADTRVLSGNEMVVARKVSVYQNDHQAMFLMTAGVRSLRDKAVTYFEESMAQPEEPLDHLFKAVNLLPRRSAGLLRRTGNRCKKAV